MMIEWQIGDDFKLDSVTCWQIETWMWESGKKKSWCYSKNIGFEPKFLFIFNFFKEILNLTEFCFLVKIGENWTWFLESKEKQKITHQAYFSPSVPLKPQTLLKWYLLSRNFIILSFVAHFYEVKRSPLRHRHFLCCYQLKHLSMFAFLSSKSVLSKQPECILFISFRFDAWTWQRAERDDFNRFLTMFDWSCSNRRYHN